MSDPVIGDVADTVCDQRQGRSLPGAPTPFRHPSYRKLALALVLSTFASGV